MTNKDIFDINYKNFGDIDTFGKMGIINDLVINLEILWILCRLDIRQLKKGFFVRSQSKKNLQAKHQIFINCRYSWSFC